MTWRATVLTTFPEMFPGALGLSLAGKALAEGKWALDLIDIRDFATDKHRSVDDTPAGGGAGMVMRADIAASAIDAARARAEPGTPSFYLSPRGIPLDQARVRALAEGPGAILLCGRFEGIDERVLEARHIEAKDAWIVWTRMQVAAANLVIGRERRRNTPADVTRSAGDENAHDAPSICGIGVQRFDSLICRWPFLIGSHFRHVADMADKPPKFVTICLNTGCDFWSAMSANSATSLPRF